MDAEVCKKSFVEYFWSAIKDTVGESFVYNAPKYLEIIVFLVGKVHIRIIGI